MGETVLDMTVLECSWCGKEEEEEEPFVFLKECGHCAHKSCARKQVEDALQRVSSKLCAIRSKAQKQTNTVSMKEMLVYCGASGCETVIGFSQLRTLVEKELLDRYEAQGVQHCLTYKEVLDLHRKCVELARKYAEWKEDNKRTGNRRGLKPASRPQASRNKRTSRGGKNQTYWASGTGYGGSNNETSSSFSQKEANAAKARQNKFDQDVQRILEEMVRCLDGIPLNPITVEGSSESSGKRKRIRLENGLKPQNGAIGQEEREKRNMFVYGILTRQVYDNKTGVCDVIRDLWRNDSLMDIGDRLGLYRTLLDVLEKFAEHSETIDVFFTRPENDENDKETVSKVIDAALTGDTIASLLNNLCSQGKIFRDTNSQNEDSSTKLILDFIDRMDRLQQVVKRNLRLGLGEDYVGDRTISKKQRRDLLTLGALNEKEREKAYVAALTGLRFKTVALIELVRACAFSHTYVAMAGEMQTNNKARTVRISREMSTLATSLPLSWGSGIFVRMDETRPDIMSVMIIGPEDTPYANGAFIFDIWLPGDYPNAPPKVTLQTTGGGQMRFNPNLYSNGKVCLSLLGTWSGPGWDPHNSTLLQVLISIQSLIMVAHPYFNEPGYEASLGTSRGDVASFRYNKTIRKGTVLYAIKDKIKNPPMVFRDVLKIHFTLKREQIIKQLKEWVSEDELMSPPQNMEASKQSAAASSSSSSSAVTYGMSDAILNTDLWYDSDGYPHPEAKAPRHGASIKSIAEMTIKELNLHFQKDRIPNGSVSIIDLENSAVPSSSDEGDVIEVDEPIPFETRSDFAPQEQEGDGLVDLTL